jgi:hypothetical protein
MTMALLGRVIKSLYDNRVLAVSLLFAHSLTLSLYCGEHLHAVGGVISFLFPSLPTRPALSFDALFDTPLALCVRTCAIITSRTPAPKSLKMITCGNKIWMKFK